MKHRKLRIAWSVAWGVVAVLLVALWVRSYWVGNVLRCPVTQTIAIRLVSQRGFYGVGLRDPSDTRDKEPNGLAAFMPEAFAPPTWHFFTRSSMYPNERYLMAPWWTVALLTATLSVAAQRPRRFSLRTLLIVTTLVAMVLGLIVAVV